MTSITRGMPEVRRITYPRQNSELTHRHFYNGYIECQLSPPTSAEACEKSSRWLWKEKLC